MSYNLESWFNLEVFLVVNFYFFFFFLGDLEFELFVSLVDIEWNLVSVGFNISYYFGKKGFYKSKGIIRWGLKSKRWFSY